MCIIVLYFPFFVDNSLARATAAQVNMFSQVAQITDNLYLSSCHAVKVNRILQLGITNIINATVEVPNINLSDVETMRINVDDVPHARLGLYFDRCADKIKQVRDRGGVTLVHCVAGVSRSSSICIAYLMKYHRMTLKDAFRHCKSRRPVVHPNPGFFKQLIEYEQKLFGRTTVKMIPSQIGFIPDLYEEELRGMVFLGGSPYGRAQRSGPSPRRY